MFKFKRIGDRKKDIGEITVGIDFSGNILRIVHLRGYKEEKELFDIFTYNTEGLKEEEIVKIIRDYFQNIKIRNPQIVSVISAQSVITKNIEIPSTNPQEIREIINLQASRHTPYSREEIIVDYIDIGVYKTNYTKILLIIVPKNIVKRNFSLLEKTSLKLDKVFFAPEAVSRMVGRILKLENSTSIFGIIHIDERFTDFIVTLKNKACFVRSIPIGASQLIYEKDKYQARFLEEIKNSLEAYRNEDIDVSPQLFILTGALEELKGLGSLLYNALRLPIREVSYWGSLHISEEIIKKISSIRNISFLNILSPLLSMRDLRVDFTPEEIKLKRSLEERGKELIKSGVYILAIFVIIFLITVSKIWTKTIYIKVLDAKLRDIEKESKVLETDFSRVSIIKKYLYERGLFLDVLAELYEILPLEMEITSLRFDEGGKLTITGTAEAMSTVFSFVEKLEKSNYFKEVKTKYTTKRKEGSRDVTDFEIDTLIKRG